MERFEEELMVCPANKSHRIARNKFLTHISKCSSYKEKQHEFQICKYNLLHIIKNENLQSHLRTCPDKPQQEIVQDQVQAERDNAFENWQERQHQTQKKDVKKDKLRKKLKGSSNKLDIQQSPPIKYKEKMNNIVRGEEEADGEEEQKLQFQDKTQQSDFNNLQPEGQNKFFQIESSADACFQLQSSLLRQVDQFDNHNQPNEGQQTDVEYQQMMDSLSINNNQKALKESESCNGRNERRKYKKERSNNNKENNESSEIGKNNRGNRIKQINENLPNYENPIISESIGQLSEQSIQKRYQKKSQQQQDKIISDEEIEQQQSEMRQKQSRGNRQKANLYNRDNLREEGKDEEEEVEQGRYNNSRNNRRQKKKIVNI